MPKAQGNIKETIGYNNACGKNNMFTIVPCLLFSAPDAIHLKRKWIGGLIIYLMVVRYFPPE